MQKKLLLMIIYFLALTSVSQEKRILISGKIIDSLGVVKNANIINLKTNQGTFSLDNGSFIILVAKGDSLQISSVQHLTKKIKINNTNFQVKSFLVKLEQNTYILDEFELKRHHLTGRLGVDINDVPTDVRDSLLRNILDFSNINMIKAEADDYIDKRVRPQIVNTLPNYYEGVGAKAKIPFKDHESILRKKLARKKAVPHKILSELGEQFFYEELKIPKEKYFHFLEYCNPLGIEKLHKENKVLELIKIFRKESISYLKIIKKE